MNDPQQPTDPTPPSEPRRPVDTEGVFTQPTPPDQGYRYAAVAQPPHRRGVLATMGKVMGALFGAAALVAVGFYLALAFTLASGEQIATDTYRKGELDNKIAVIAVYGLIDGGSAEFARHAADKVIADTTVKAVVIHVQSGGGGVNASELMYGHFQRMRRELDKQERKVPIIASYEAVAASGGYYVSCDADRIYADPTCVTGSVGVMAPIPVMKDLFEKKLGVKWMVLTAEGSPEKDVANNQFREWDDRDIDAVMSFLNANHDRFLDIVKAGRVATERMTEEQFAASTTGAAYLAAKAKELGLIDEVGYLDDAIEYARQEAGLGDVKPMVVRYRARTGGMMSVLFGHKAEYKVPLPEVSMDADSIREVFNELSRTEAMYLYRP